MYPHELRERVKNASPMNRTYPLIDASADTYREVYNYLKSRELPWSVAEMNGWYPSRDCNDAFIRVVIPAVTVVPGHSYWQARDVTGKARLRYQSPRGPRLDAFIHVRPLHDAKKIAVICEGPMDALRAAGLGYHGVALMGISPPLSTMQVVSAYLKAMRHPLIVALDRDAQAEAVAISVFLSSQGMQAPIAGLPAKDLAALSPDECDRLLRGAYEKRTHHRSRKAQPRKHRS